MFSRTLFVTLADGSEVVVQFHIELLDLDTFKIAKGSLGSFVPDASALEDEELENHGAWDDFACYWRYLPYHGLLKSDHIFFWSLILLFGPMSIFPEYLVISLINQVIFLKLTYISTYRFCKIVYISV